MIRMQQLVKAFGERLAVNQLDLHIKPGEIFGLLGPNGAGKTTIIRMLTTLTKPSAGVLSINGYSLPADAEKIKELLGIVPQHSNLDPDLTVEENLKLHARLRHIPLGCHQQQISAMLDYVELTARRSDRVQQLSGGMRRRLMIARALLHRPRILVLDEPTVGLDPQVRRRLWELVNRLRGDLTVLLTTHYIEEAEALCDRVAILEQGRLMALDTPQALCRRTGNFVVEWQTPLGRETRFFPERQAAAAFSVDINGALTIRPSNLEDVFVALTGKKVME